MASPPVYCYPAARSQHHVHVEQGEGFVSFFLKGVSRRTRGRLQCWTNLPCLNALGREDGWHAINVGGFLPDKEGEQSLMARYEVPVQALQRSMSKGKTLDFQLTWRVISTSLDSRPTIEWLGETDSNAIVSFHLDQQDSLQRLIDDLHVIEGANVDREGKGVAVLSISLDISPETAGKEAFTIMHPSRAITGGAVWERTKSTWHTSRSISQMSDISEQYFSSMIVMQFSQVDKVVVVLPICTDSATVTLNQKEGAMHAVVDQFKQPGDASEYRAVITIGPSCDVHALIRRCFKHIGSASLEHRSTAPFQSPLLGLHGLGFCSWEALGAGRERPSLSNLSAVLEKVEKRASGSIKALIIDDGWQHISRDESDKRRLRDFDLDPGLVETKYKVDSPDRDHSRLALYITVLRSRFPHIDKIAVWSTLAGYWDGLDPDDFPSQYGPLVQARLVNPFLVNEGYSWFLPAFDKLELFYNDYFSFLKKAGIDFVKVDDQADWEWIQELTCSVCDVEMTTSDGNEKENWIWVQKVDIIPSVYYDNAWKAMTKAAHKHFGEMCVINSMAQGHRFFTHQTRSIAGLHLARNSDDTFPNVPQSHIWHIYHNAMNACLSAGNVNILPDADMITSYMPSEHDDADWADYHTAFRSCFSASTIWISDSVAVSDRGKNGVLDRLLAPSKNISTNDSLGQLKTIQNSNINTNNLPLPESVFASLTDDVAGPALKMSHSWKSSSKQVHGAVLSVWNTRYQSSSTDSITVANICQVLDDDDTDESCHFIFSSSDPKKAIFVPSIPKVDFQISKHQSSLTSQSLISFTLQPASYRIFSVMSALPVTPHTQIACVGLIKKYNGLQAVVDVSTVQGEKVGISASLSRAGKCGFLYHGKKQHWYVEIDGIAVQADCISSEAVQDCHLVVIDMIKHLQMAKFFDTSNEELWRVEVYQQSV
jgi:hypothetical protein